MQRFFRIYIVPGAVIQSVMVGGGYGTGREIVEYFSRHGAQGGLLAIGVAFVLLAAVTSLTFEFARTFRAFDYRLFFKALLGPAWLTFEVLIIVLFLLILAVLASAAGNIFLDTFGLPYGAGLLTMLVIIGVLTFFGRQLITTALSVWSVVLYAILIAFLVAVFSSDQFSLAGQLNEASDAGSLGAWVRSGVQYTSYNIAVIPLLLYVARDFHSRKEAIGSGVIASTIALLPALMFHIAFVAASPEVLGEALPVFWMIGKMGYGTLLLVYSVMLFGTFIETGAGILQGINERIDGYFEETNGSRLSPRSRAGIAVFAILASAGLSQIGITELIAKGYGTIAWGFLLIYAIPLVTIGVYRLSYREAARYPL